MGESFEPVTPANLGFWAQFFSMPQLVCAKSIFTLILNVSDKFIEKCRRSRLFVE